MSGGIVKEVAIVFSVSTLFAFAFANVRAEAGGLRHRGGSVVASPVRYVPTQRAVPATLGSGFVATPTIMVRGNGTAGGGYSPLGQFGEATMVLYGPLSALRTTSAPVMTYARGYDGRIVPVPGTSFSMPNQPRLSPVIYPTQATNYYGFRQSGSPPWWQNGINWIDQN